MASFKNFSDRELIDILSEHDKLSIVAKKDLKKELKSRNIQGQNEILEKLDLEISKENRDIQNLKQIGNLGLTLESTGSNYFKISRSGKAIFFDILAIAMGIIFTVFGLIGIANLLTFSSLVIGIPLTILGIAGPKIFINGINRIVEYSGFSFEVRDEMFYLKKRFDLKLENIQGEVSSLYIENSSDLMFKNISLITVNAANTVNTSTLKAILLKSQGKGS